MIEKINILICYKQIILDYQKLKKKIPKNKEKMKLKKKIVKVQDIKHMNMVKG